jgi:lipopolysaccharide biosynthesis protein
LLRTSTRLIAFYLPQFHPIPENDEWWGKGFTEWTNVAKARPSFPGRYQPHIPADLGFYALRLSETRQAQADLARQYGIYGFACYHYWFHGRRLLERPFNEVLSSGQPDSPFCLRCAKENWTRAWDEQERHVLLAQTYSDDDDRQHIRWLAEAFEDKRYIRINGKPLFLVYRASRLPNPQRSASVWRDEALKARGGGDIHCPRARFSGRT